MTNAPAETGAAPVTRSERITNLDTVRGIAVLGILLMNAVSFGLPDAAYFNLDAAGSETWLDWAIGGFGEIFIDQKMMGLFSVLFGAGIVLFADRAAMKEARAGLLSLWRNTLLLGIGLVHTVIWDGDILTVYALCAPILIAVRNWRPRTLLVLGVATVLWSALVAVLVDADVPASGDGLGEFWLTDGNTMSNSVAAFLLNDFFARALGMMLIGVALYRLEVLQGLRPPALYRKMALIGLGVGLPIAVLGLALQVANDFSLEYAILGELPNTFATIPITLGYLALITLWNQREDGAWHLRFRAAGRMALTNYLTQTLIGVAVLRELLADEELTRTAVLLFVLAVWALQLAWSQPWLERFRYGPFEWLWRCATYRSWQPLRR